tara:strand:- start:377 stop:1339 length:963 start_codon:yes stop_codon:yes gene_type:complete
MSKKIKLTFQKIYQRILEKSYVYLKKDLIIKAYQYGRLGNNIQQFLLLVAHFKVFGANFTLDNKFIKSYEQDINFKALPGFIEINNKSNRKIISNKILIKNNMYLYTRFYQKFFRNSFMSNRVFRDAYLSKNKFLSLLPELVEDIRPALKNFILSKEINNIKIHQRNDICVLHLRGGDTIPPQNLNHISNPISYYRWLNKYYKSIIIVHEPSTLNPIINELYKIFDVKKTISSSLKNDFALIANSKNVATSGVGTFAISACLFNKKIKNLFYSDAFLNEHINPNFISNRVKKHCYLLGREFYIKWAMANPQERLKLVYKF